MTTPTQTERLKELLAKATPGPWVVAEKPKYDHILSADGRYIFEPGRPVVQRQDAQVIVAAVNALPELLVDLEAARRELAEVRERMSEREHDMHMRIRAGYDQTVADLWKAHCKGIESERDQLRAELAEEMKGLRGLVANWKAEHAFQDDQRGYCGAYGICATQLEELLPAAPSANLGGGAET